jgi:hypothetical protein
MTEQLKINVFALLLRRLAREMEGLSEEDIHAIVQDRSPILRKRLVGHSGKHHETLAAAPIDIDALLQRLRDLSDRDIGTQLIIQEVTSRSDLLKLAKVIDVPVVKRHTVAQIVEKIVDATIGFRTRSAAIRGESAD